MAHGKGRSSQPPVSSVAEGPPLPSHRPPGGSVALPVELSSFIGRERELAELRTLLARNRLLTLTGAGGSGKSRLAMELVRAMAEEVSESVWVELAGLQDSASLPRAILEAFGVHEDVDGPDPEALVAYLRGRSALLVLDNCEHLVDACAQLAHTLVKRCPSIRILSTSREALGVKGERAWLVPPLSLPGGVGSLEALKASEAVRLFEERARDVVGSFRLDEANSPAVAEICRRLDGIPLAIELAAARVKVLTPQQIRERLHDAFRLLSSADRSSIPRHRTLRAAMDWSHDLLRESARILLRRLSVFRGGFVLGGAERVGAGGAIAGEEVLDLVAHLVDRSLVVVREHRGEARYRLLETVRQYAAQRLAESGEAEEVRRRHAHQVLALVRTAEPHLIGRERRTWVDTLQTETENIREALSWSREHEPSLHVELVARLWWFFYSTQHWLEAGRWMEGALALPAASEPGRTRGALLFAEGALAALQGRAEAARGFLGEAAELAAAFGDQRLEAYALNYLGMTYAGEGRHQASSLCGRAAAWFEANDDLYGLRLALLLQGSAALGGGDMETAERHNAAGVAVARRFGLDRELAVSLQNLAAVHMAAGELREAEALLRESLAASRRDPSYFFISVGLQYLGEVTARRGRPIEAARLLGAAEAIREAMGVAGFKRDRDRLAAALPGLRQAAGEVAFDRAWDQGRATPPEALLAELEEAVESPTVRPAPAAQRPPQLTVLALGPLVVAVEGQTLGPGAWPYTKPKELLVYLLAQPGGGARDRVAQALWPQATATRLKNSFHVTLHHLRKALGHPEWVVLQDDRYRLAAGVSAFFDADRFETEARGALVDAGTGPEALERLRSVLSLYRGDFLEDEVVGAWAEDIRDRLRRLQVELSLRLGHALEAAGGIQDALNVYQAVAAREELNEEAHRRLLSCLARSGHRARALQHYQRVVETLHDALDAEPEPETVALHERIRAGGVPLGLSAT
jgi:predicted ATPase/two-component SAPR family response regulator